MSRGILRTVRITIVAGIALLWTAPAVVEAQDRRPMDYPDLFRQATASQVDLSPDGTRILYRVTPGSFPDPRADHTQIRIAALDGTDDRPLTHAEGARNSGPRWHPSGTFFGFTSSRDRGGRQIYIMSPDGGEPRRVTASDGGVRDWAWSRDGAYLAYLAGRDAERQLWIMDGRGEGEARRLTRHPTPVERFAWREESNEILFLAPDAWDEAEHERRNAGFEARPIQRGLVFDDFIHLHPSHLWRIGAEGGPAIRLTEGELVVHRFEDSPPGDRIAIVAGPLDPHADSRSNEIYLVDPDRGEMERVTDNDVSEQIVGFSPDGSYLAITARRNFEGRGVRDVFVRPVDGGEWRAVTVAFDNDLFDPVWSADGSRIYFVGADGLNRHLYEADVRRDGVRRITDRPGVVSIPSSRPHGRAVLGFSDATAPTDLYAVTWRDAGREDRWTRLTRLNPWLDEIELAETEVVRWTSVDGTEVEGLLVHPLDRDPARPYPLITEIHGGPASAFLEMYLPTANNPHRAYGHLLAARGYALFLPNYRGSSHYGHDFQVQIVGDYWTRATEDILTGIDHLVARGIAHPDSLGVMGWSAGGHWSNWLLVTTDRFRAISTGAGVVNWISLYGQTDNQASREWYLGRDVSLSGANKPWDDFEHWWAESPLKHIRNASTPTLIHYPERDQRVPLPQGQELHMALKSLDVPTEFFVYPDELHALRDPRNQLVKLLADLGWFEHWIRGEDSWFDWSYVMDVANRIETEVNRAP